MHYYVYRVRSSDRLDLVAEVEVVDRQTSEQVVFLECDAAFSSVMIRAIYSQC